MRLFSSILCCVSLGLNLAAWDRTLTLAWLNPTRVFLSLSCNGCVVRAVPSPRRPSAGQVSRSFPLGQSQHLSSWPRKGCCASSHHVCISGGKSRRGEGKGACWPSVLVSGATTWARSLCPDVRRTSVYVVIHNVSLKADCMVKC